MRHAPERRGDPIHVRHSAPAVVGERLQAVMEGLHTPVLRSRPRAVQAVAEVEQAVSRVGQHPPARTGTVRQQQIVLPVVAAGRRLGRGAVGLQPRRHHVRRPMEHALASRVEVRRTERDLDVGGDRVVAVQAAIGTAFRLVTLQIGEDRPVAAEAHGQAVGRVVAERGVRGLGAVAPAAGIGAQAGILALNDQGLVPALRVDQRIDRRAAGHPVRRGDNADGVVGHTANASPEDVILGVGHVSGRVPPVRAEDGAARAEMRGIRIGGDDPLLPGRVQHRVRVQVNGGRGRRERVVGGGPGGFRAGVVRVGAQAVTRPGVRERSLCAGGAVRVEAGLKIEIVGRRECARRPAVERYCRRPAGGARGARRHRAEPGLHAARPRRRVREIALRGGQLPLQVDRAHRLPLCRLRGGQCCLQPRHLGLRRPHRSFQRSIDPGRRVRRRRVHPGDLVECVDRRRLRRSATAGPCRGVGRDHQPQRLQRLVGRRLRRFGLVPAGRRRVSRIPGLRDPGDERQQGCGQGRALARLQ